MKTQGLAVKISFPLRFFIYVCGCGVILCPLFISAQLLTQNDTFYGERGSLPYRFSLGRMGKFVE